MTEKSTIPTTIFSFLHFYFLNLRTQLKYKHLSGTDEVIFNINPDIR